MRQQGNPNKRLRGRPRKGPNPLTRTYESNGPDVKVRGTALHIAEKYVQLARDAQSSGDTVMAENYFQHAEHYYRIVAASQAQSPQPFSFTRDDDARGDEDEDDLVMERAPRAPAFVPIDAPQPYMERAMDRAPAPDSGNGAHRSVAGERRERRSRQGRGDRPPRPDYAPEPQPMVASDDVPAEEPVYLTVTSDIEAGVPAEEPAAVVDLEDESPRPRRRARGGRGRGRRSESAMADAGGGEMAPAEAGPPGDA